MKIKIVEDCVLGGGHCAAGTVVDADEKTALALIKFGRAVQEIGAAIEAGRIEVREPQVENREPVIVKRKRKNE